MICAASKDRPWSSGRTHMHPGRSLGNYGVRHAAAHVLEREVGMPGPEISEQDSLGVTEQEAYAQRLKKIAEQVLTLSRNTLVVNLRFLDAALSQFQYVPYMGTMATDGKNLMFDPLQVLRMYKEDATIPTREYLHTVMHCVFQHMYVAPSVDRRIWNLATNIAVEYSIADLRMPAITTPREVMEKPTFDDLEAKVKKMTAERIYHYLKDRELSEKELRKLEGVFNVDDHQPWYQEPEDDDQGKEGSGAQPQPSASPSRQPRRGQGDKEQSDEDTDNEGEDQDTSDKGDRDQDGKDKQEGQGDYESDDGDQNDRGSGSQPESQDGGAQSAIARADQQQIWKDIAEGIQLDLETFNNERFGSEAGGMVQNLREVNRERYDYSEFLRKFAVMGEVMKIDDDSFDYVFYTYGLKLYEKMPLIEPLEYKEVKRVREFVIAIDTSGSVAGDLVQKFVQKTYNVLKSTESFFSRVNLHILQCDTQIQEHVKITSQEEFDDYIVNMKIKGLGGTDFRPVFNEVNKLIEEHEFSNLKGLIYFTDGWGSFPAKKPPYDTAFVFVGDEYMNPDVPPWAIKLVLSPDEIEEAAALTPPELVPAY